ncbi:MAG: FAD-dependent oxidoreductase, partial [Lentisphaeria bacterium]|nr:FAD-dependent oxidoreductase [Lentisphaeria bacterium]
RANAVEVRGGRIAAVIAQNVTTGERLRFSGRWFADCTGDAAIGALAGAEYDMTRKGHMGRCNLWNVKETDAPVPFPRCPWALDLSDKPFPGRDGQGGIEQLGGWYWESGFDRDPITDREAIRDWNFRAMYGAWDALKNVQKLYPNHTLNWAAHIAGPRESRRLMGDIELTAEDLFAERQFEDGCVATGWEIDVHLPEKQYEAGFEGDAFISKAHFTKYPKPFYVPYRCLYSRNVPNLFMAGRNVSVTHEALGSVRVMRTGGLMGEVVGLAAACCKAHHTDPRQIYENHWEDFRNRLLAGVGAKS